MLKITAYAHSILCVEDAETQADITRDLSAEQLAAILATIHALPGWKEHAASGSQFGMDVQMRVLPAVHNWAVWDEAYLTSQDAKQGIYEAGFATRAEAEAALPRIQTRLEAVSAEEQPIGYLAAAPAPSDYQEGDFPC